MERLHINSTLADLQLHRYAVETSCLGHLVYQKFEEDSVLPGVILLSQEGQLQGIVSRRRFFESMSRAYGRELFLRRPISVLHRFIAKDILELPESTLVTDAAEAAIARSSEILYEPILVAGGTPAQPQYYLLDVHDVLQAQSRIHQLTAQLLQEKTRAEMMQTEKMASLGKMMAGVAHEIRNPVNFIWGNLKYIAEYVTDLTTMIQAFDQEVTAPSPELCELKQRIDLNFVLEDLPNVLQSMETGADRLRNLVTSLRTFSRMDEIKRYPTDIHQSLDSTLQILNSRLKEGITVRKYYAENLPEIFCFSGQIGQVFMNLISNAIDALLEHQATLAAAATSSDFAQTERSPSSPQSWEPCLTLITALRDQLPEDAVPRPLSSSPAPPSWISIRIQDNGSGIPSEIQSKVFDDFFTTKAVSEGTGLGLPITRQIVTEKHGGYLILRSPYPSPNPQQPAQGTEFEILLPVQMSPEPSASSFPDKDTFAGVGEQLLSK